MVTMSGLKRPPVTSPMNTPLAKRRKTDAGPVAAPDAFHPHGPGLLFGAQATTASETGAEKVEKAQDGTEKASTDEPKPSKWNIERIADRIIDFINWIQEKLESLSQKFSEFLDHLSEKLNQKKDESAEQQTEQQKDAKAATK
jgi:hypothetical protein